MQGRTFFRVMFDTIFNNAFCKTIVSFVNYCNENRYYNNKELKFLNKMPLNKIPKENFYKNKFVFNSITTHKSGSN